jgi:hypothetical protein
MQQTAPFKLEDGILLEESGTVLPWGAELNQLLEIEGGHQSRWEEVSWLNKKVLGGMLANVKFIVRRKEFDIVPIYDQAEDLERAYEKTIEHLTATAGPPHKVHNDRSNFVKDLVYPVSTWQWENIRITCRTYEGDGALVIPFCELCITKLK